MKSAPACRPDGGPTLLGHLRDHSAPPVSRRATFAAVAAIVLAVATAGTPAFAAKPTPPATMLPITITDVVLQDGQLLARGTIGNNPFTAPVTLAPAGTAQDGCPILNLALGPIHLDLLGLVVDTSPICLNIIANPGAGNLLGNLLCSVAGLLDPAGSNVGTVLGGLDAGAAQALLNGITGLLNGALGAVTAPNAGTAVGGTQAGACDILNLSLGPVDLNLLGLEVMLDDCNDGPVTVDVTAVSGAGNLLGNLLCNLAGLLDTPANGTAIAAALNRVADAILQLVNAL